MVKAIISAIVGLALVITASLLESNYVQKTFDNFNQDLTAIYKKIKEETATEEELISLQDKWFSKKEELHIFIPHNEIKEVDLWLSEAVSLIKNKDYEETGYRIEVVINLIKQIAKTFSFRLENIL